MNSRTGEKKQIGIREPRSSILLRVRVWGARERTRGRERRWRYPWRRRVGSRERTESRVNREERRVEERAREKEHPTKVKNTNTKGKCKKSEHLHGNSSCGGLPRQQAPFFETQRRLWERDETHESKQCQVFFA